MVLVSGAELFTGNTALVTAAYMEGKTSGKDLAKNWIASYLGNFVGSLLMAYLVFASGTLGNLPGAANIATAKSSLSFTAAFTRGIMCNWLVCMAVYMASGCSTMIGKMTAVWFPISAFVALVSVVLGVHVCVRLEKLPKSCYRWARKSRPFVVLYSMPSSHLPSCLTSWVSLLWKRPHLSGP